MNFSIFFHSKVSPSKPKFDGSAQKTISKEIQDAIKQFLSSNDSSFTVSTYIFVAGVVVVVRVGVFSLDSPIGNSLNIS